MTDRAPFSPDDEIVSAVLDGQATADEQARVLAQPELATRLEELGRVRAAVAEPVGPLDEVTARRLLDRAMDTAQEDGTVHSSWPRSPRTARSWWRGGAAVGLGSAALVVLLAMMVLPALLGGTGDDADQTASVADSGAGEERADAPPDEAEAAPDASAADGFEPFAEDADGADDELADPEGHLEGGDQGSPAAGSDRVWLGRFDSDAELHRALMDEASTSTGAGATAEPVVPECPGGFDLDGIDIGDSAEVFEALLGEVAVVAVVGVDRGGTPQVAALDLSTCEAIELE